MAAIDEALDRVPDVKGVLDDPTAIEHTPIELELLQLALLLYACELLDEVRDNTEPA
jgi:hypothetical protein